MYVDVWNKIPTLQLLTTINSKCIKNLHIQPNTLRLLEESIKNTHQDIGIGKEFMGKTPAAQAGKTKTNGTTSN